MAFQSDKTSPSALTEFKIARNAFRAERSARHHRERDRRAVVTNPQLVVHCRESDAYKEKFYRNEDAQDENLIEQAEAAQQEQQQNHAGVGNTAGLSQEAAPPALLDQLQEKSASSVGTTWRCIPCVLVAGILLFLFLLGFGYMLKDAAFLAPHALGSVALPQWTNVDVAELSAFGAFVGTTVDGLNSVTSSSDGVLSGTDENKNEEGDALLFRSKISSVSHLRKAMDPTP